MNEVRSSGPVILLAFDSKGVALSTQLLRRELTSRGYDATVCLANTDTCDDAYLRGLGRVLASRRPRILGVSLMSQDISAASVVLGGFREADPEGFVVAGGVHTTVATRATLRALPINAAVRGGGEKALLSLLEGGRGTRNTQWPDDTTDAAFAPPMPMEERAIGVLSPDYLVVPHNKVIEPLGQPEHARLHHWNQSYYHTITAFGCPYRCTYCTNLYSRALSRRRVGQVIEEIQGARDKYPALTSVNFHDDCFVMADDDWPRLFAREYGRLGGRFIARMMPKYVRRPTVQLLSESGLAMVKIGLQGSDRINRQVFGRAETRESFLDAVSSLHKCGVRYEVDVIIDNPYETEADLREVIETLNACPKPFRVHAYNLIPYPGTELRNAAESRGELDRFACRPGAESSRAYMTPSCFRQLIVAIPWLPSTQVRALADDPYARHVLPYLQEFFSDEYMQRVAAWTGAYHGA